MEAITIGLAIGAFAMSIVAIFFEVFFYRWQTQQGGQITDRVTDFASAMKELLGELRGVAMQTNQTQQAQFQTMLDAFVASRVPAVEAAVQAQTGPQVGEIIQRLDSVEKLIAEGSGNERLQSELTSIRAAIGNLDYQIRGAVSQGLSSQGLAAPSDEMAYRARTVWMVMQNPGRFTGPRDPMHYIFMDTFQRPLIDFINAGLLAFVDAGGNNVRLVPTQGGASLARSFGFRI